MKQNNNLDLVSINAPALNKTNYGEHLEQQFKNIDSNFKKIVATDFLKGNAGESVQMIEVEFEENGTKSYGLYLNGEEITSGKLYSLVKAAILGDINENDQNINSLVNTGNVNWLDSLKSMNKVTFFYRTDEEEKRNIVSSLYYTYLDARFSQIQYSDIASYEGATDLSCILFLQKDRTDKLVFNRVNTFPTLYYDADMINADSNENDKYGTFCWRINGNDTGIPAVGPRGEAGKSNTLYLVKVDGKPADASHKHVIKEVLSITDEGSIFLPLSDFLRENDVEFSSNTFVLAINEDLTVQGEVGEWNEDGETHMWASPVIVEENVDNNGNVFFTYFAYCDNSNSILNVYNAKSIMDAMGGIGFSEVLYGLLVPISESYTNINGDLKQPAHMIYALPLEGSAVGTNILNHLYIAPMDDIHTKPGARKIEDGHYLYEPESSEITFLYNMTNIGNRLNVKGNTTFNKNITTNGTATFNKAIYANGSMSYFGGEVQFEDNVRMLSNLNISGSDGDIMNILANDKSIIQRCSTNDLDFEDIINIYNGTKFDENTNQTVDNSYISLVRENMVTNYEDEENEFEAPVNVYKNTKIYGDLGITGAFNAGSIEVDQDIVSGEGNIVSKNANIRNNLTVSGTTTCDGGLNVDKQLKVSGNSSISGLLNITNNEDGDKKVEVKTNSYFYGDVTFNKNVVDNIDDTNNDSIKSNVIIHPASTLDDITSDFKVTSEYKNIQGLGTIISRNAKSALNNISISATHDIKRNSVLGSLLKIGNIKPNTTLNDESSWKSLKTLWENPLTNIDYGSYIENTADIILEYNTATKGESIVLWTKENSTEGNPENFRIKFDKDFTALFTVSGRNLFSDAALKKNSKWARPSWYSSLMVVTLTAKYSGGGTESYKIIDKTDIPNVELFTHSGDEKDEKKKFSYDGWNKGPDALENKWGDTALCRYTATPKNDIYYIDANNLIEIYMDVAVNFLITKPDVKKDKKRDYTVFRGLKLLGILPSSMSALGSCESTIVTRSIDHTGTGKESMALEDIYKSNKTTGEAVLSKMFKSGNTSDKTDGASTYEVGYKNISKISVRELRNSIDPNGYYIDPSGTYNKNKFTIDSALRDSDSVVNLRLYNNKLNLSQFLKAEVQITSDNNFDNPNVHIFPAGILFAHNPHTYAYIISEKNGNDSKVLIGSVRKDNNSNGENVTKKIETDLYSLLKACKDANMIDATTWTLNAENYTWNKD